MATAAITLDELDTFHQKFERFAEELSSRELAFLQALLTGAGAETGDDVEGHMLELAFVPANTDMLHHLNHLLAIVHNISVHRGHAIPLPHSPRA